MLPLCVLYSSKPWTSLPLLYSEHRHLTCPAWLRLVFRCGPSVRFCIDWLCVAFGCLLLIAACFDRCDAVSSRKAPIQRSTNPAGRRQRRGGGCVAVLHAAFEPELLVLYARSQDTSGAFNPAGKITSSFMKLASAELSRHHPCDTLSHLSCCHLFVCLPTLLA